MKLILLEIWAILTVSVIWAGAQSRDELPTYRPEQQLVDTEIIRSWGSNDMASLMKSWETGFREYHPEVRFSDRLKGTETAQAALYTNVADLALMGREILMLERHVMFRRTHHFPLEIMVATGSYDVADKTCALAVFVHKRNPITHLSLAQLDGIFGDERTGAWDDKFRWHPELGRTADNNIRSWGGLGLTGEWARQAIHVYGYPVTIYSPVSGPMLFFRAKAFHGGDIWNPSLVELETGEEIADRIRRDPYGIGYTCLCYGTADIKPLALAADPNGTYVELTKENVAGRAYPLTRSIYIYINRDPDKPVDPKLKEFLRYVLSRQGQGTVARDGSYLPLTTELVSEQLKKLE